MAPASIKEVLHIQGNYRVWIHSETRTWHDNNIQTGVDTLFSYLHKSWPIFRFRDSFVASRFLNCIFFSVLSMIINLFWFHWIKITETSGCVILISYLYLQVYHPEPSISILHFFQFSLLKFQFFLFLFEFFFFFFYRLSCINFFLLKVSYFWLYDYAWGSILSIIQILFRLICNHLIRFINNTVFSNDVFLLFIQYR